ncbi:MAG: hypothetical protein HDR21_07250 [Lachnospiraceae bacterium]|nr:hypothetical protein [Lachnospiraceae bacterium]
MNILVIGNGFDLAHGLPTKYGDFLEFVKVIRQVVKIENRGTCADVEWGKIHPQIKELIIQINMNLSKEILFEMQRCNELLDQNTWIDYFLQCNTHLKENWIDFEIEIGKVIRSIERDMKKYNCNENSTVHKSSVSFLEKRFVYDLQGMECARVNKAYEEIKRMEESEGRRWNFTKKIDYVNKYKKNHPIDSSKEEFTYKQMITNLEYDLDRLICALEIYIDIFVTNVPIDYKNSDIDGLKLDHVLSFNYSNTFERIYGDGKEKQIEYDYIHGKAGIDNKIESNVVLGIDEYLSKNKRNKEINFIAFKKYYQRIYKGTGCRYKDWIYEIKEGCKITESKLQKLYPIQIPFNKFSDHMQHNIYIFGHSLDVTDKDILKELILNDNVYTTIFYLDRKDLRNKITNLVLVIGQDELIRRTGGSTKTIEFKLQQNMVERV